MGNQRTDEMGCPYHGYGMPEPERFCVQCEDIIEANEQYIDFDGDSWCLSCFAKWKEEHTKWS